MGELQKWITSTCSGFITSVQVVYVPADDLATPAATTTFTHFDRYYHAQPEGGRAGYLLGGGPLQSSSRLQEPVKAGEKHCPIACGIQEIWEKCSELHDFIAILGMDELSDEDRTTVVWARKI